jgi:hypothetical protein
MAKPQEAVGVFFNAQFRVWPGGKTNILLEVFYLESVFNVDG